MSLGNVGMYSYFRLAEGLPKTPVPMVGNIENVASQSGAAMQHPLNPVGQHSFAPQRTPSMMPQGVHAFAPMGQQYANQQAFAAQQAAEQKRLADALRAQQEAEAAAQAQQNQDYGFYTG